MERQPAAGLFLVVMLGLALSVYNSYRASGKLEEASGLVALGRQLAHDAALKVIEAKTQIREAQILVQSARERSEYWRRKNEALEAEFGAASRPFDTNVWYSVRTATEAFTNCYWVGRCPQHEDCTVARWIDAATITEKHLGLTNDVKVQAHVRIRTPD